jgi:hypothetical protein
MRFRALFVGGPVDGQERVLPHCNQYVGVRGTSDVYRRLFTFGMPRTFVYSLYDIEETMNRLWHRYAGEDHA